MTRTSHSPGASVVDIWARKRRRGLPNWNQGKRWLGRAQTKPGLARYRTKAFTEEQDAWQWAENTVAKYRLGLDNGNRCSISGVREVYLEHLRGKGVSRNHIFQARWILGRLIDAGINDLRDERLPAKAEAFFQNLRTQVTNQDGSLRRKTSTDAAARTKNCYLSVLMALCAWATRMRMLPYDPLKGVITRVKEPKAIKPIFSIDELKAILSDKLRNERYWLPFALSIYGSFRIAEAMHVSWEDIKWTERRIHVRIKPEYSLKGKRERWVPLQNELCDILRPMAKPHGWIIDDKTRTNRKTWRWFFMKLLRAAGVPPAGRSPHSTRHTWAALLISSGVDSFLVMESAGHSNLSTTLGYARCASFYRDAVKGWEKGEFQLRASTAGVCHRLGHP